jgi:hypothetical protein
MSLIEKFQQINKPKFSFGKSTEFAPRFAIDIGAHSMYEDGFGLGIPDQLSGENQLRAIFVQINMNQGIFLFNISGVNLKRAKHGFESYDEAEQNNEITEWELSLILNNKDYLKRCIFHNGKVEFKRQKIWKAVK